jgi:hypothetical protein
MNTNVDSGYNYVVYRVENDYRPTRLLRLETINAAISRDSVAQRCPLIDSALHLRGPLGESVAPSGYGPFKT